MTIEIRKRPNKDVWYVHEDGSFIGSFYSTDDGDRSRYYAGRLLASRLGVSLVQSNLATMKAKVRIKLAARGF